MYGRRKLSEAEERSVTIFRKNKALHCCFISMRKIIFALRAIMFKVGHTEFKKKQIKGDLYAKKIYSGRACG